MNACTDKDGNTLPACGVNNPTEDLAWLKAEIDRRNETLTKDMKYCYIVQAELNGQDVFIYEDCNPLINKAIFILTCEGTEIDTQESALAFEQLKNKTIIWKGNDFACQINL